MINELKLDDSSSIDVPLGFTVFCDMDGTLVDTDYVNYLSYRRALIEVTCGRLDVEFTDERLNGESLKVRFPLLTAWQLEKIAALKAEYFMELISETRLNASLANLISNHCENNIIILVTYCQEKRAVEVLKHHKLLKFFTRLICWENLPQGGSSNKYESAIRLMGVSLESVFVFENDNICIEEAVRAGVPRTNIHKVFIKSGIIL